jgi:hypothetical protein
VSCYHPTVAYRSKTGRDPLTGSWPIVFNVNDGYRDLEVSIPCGKCIGCTLDRARQWTVRILCEAQMNKKNCFLTLTYNDENIPIMYDDDYPIGYTLNKEHFQKFMKRLRKAINGEKIRYFHCGEYGDRLGRPHYHAAIFGYDFPDKKAAVVRGEYIGYRSELLTKCWPHGHHEIGQLTAESAAYVARYIIKKVKGGLKEEYYEGRQEEYITQSLGIGKEWFKKYHGDVFPGDQVRMQKMVVKPPRYFDKKLKEIDEKLERRIKYRRQKNIHEEDNTYERLAVRERCQIKKLDKYKRQYEEFKNENCDIFST